MRSVRKVIPFVAVLAIQQNASAIILVGGGNSVNVTAPASGAPWDEVARITSLDGSHTTSGSAVHLGGGYMLTANHVNLGQGYVSFDGTTTFQIAGGSAVQVTHNVPMGETPDVVDLKVFQLTQNPGSSGVPLFPEAFKGFEPLATTHIGWGVGQNPSDTDNPWAWGDGTTSTKRWGENDFTGVTDLAYLLGGVNYSFESLVTALDVVDDGEGGIANVNEAAATNFDSGSGLFIEDGGGTWFLAATMAAVSTNGSSTFAAADDAMLTQDLNFSVRIAEYSNEIIALLDDPLPIPEPRTSGLLLGLGAFYLVCFKRRRA